MSLNPGRVKLGVRVLHLSKLYQNKNRNKTFHVTETIRLAFASLYLNKNIFFNSSACDLGQKYNAPQVRPNRGSNS